LHREVRRGADARGGVGKPLLAREADQPLQVLRRHRGIDGDDVRRARAEDHRHEVGERIVARVRIEARVHRIRDARHQQRVAIGGRALHLLRGEVAARAALVLDYHGLSEDLAELRRGEPRDDVGGAARREADEDVDLLLLRPVLGERGSREKQEQGKDAHAPDATIAAPVNILFASETEKAEFWLPLLEQALPKDRFFVREEKSIDVALVATPPAGTLRQLKGVKLIQSLWMGVEKLLAD